MTHDNGNRRRAPIARIAPLPGISTTFAVPSAAAAAIAAVATVAAIAAVSTAPVLAQTPTGELRTLAPYGVFAIQAAQADFESWPANTVIPSGQASIDASIDHVSVATLVGWRASGGTVSCDVSEQGVASAPTAPGVGGTTSSPSSVGVLQGPHELLFRVLGAPGLRGKLQIWGTGLADPGATVTLAADLGNDTSIDFQVTTPPGVGVFDRRQWDLRLDMSGALAVRIVTGASVALASGSTRFKTGISVVFTPGDFCDIGGYGSSCGSWLTGSDAVVGAMRELTWYLNDAPASTAGVLAIGTQRWSVPLPGTSCLLLTDPLVVLPFTTDGFGMGQHKLRAPLGLPFALNLQDVLLTPPATLTSSNAVAITCR